MGDTTLLENDEAPGTESNQIDEDAENYDVSDDEELYAPSETFEVAKLKLPPGTLAAPDMTPVDAADDTKLDAALHPEETVVQKRYHRMCEAALGQLEVL